jgi:hypothetical protein
MSDLEQYVNSITDSPLERETLIKYAKIMSFALNQLPKPDTKAIENRVSAIEGNIANLYAEQAKAIQALEINKKISVEKITELNERIKSVDSEPKPDLCLVDKPPKAIFAECGLNPEFTLLINEKSYTLSQLSKMIYRRGKFDVTTPTSEYLIPEGADDAHKTRFYERLYEYISSLEKKEDNPNGFIVFGMYTRYYETLRKSSIA